LVLLVALAEAVLPPWRAGAALREENFDHEPATREGINNRNTHFAPRTVTQDFGYSPATSHAGGQPGEVGGKINPAGEAAYYGYRLPKPVTLDQPLSVSGRMFVPAGPGHFLLGFFNANTLNGWRTPNTLVVRINGRGDAFHCHLEYCTSRWRAGAGVIGEAVPGERIDAKLMSCAQVYEWRLTYDPGGAQGNGQITVSLDSQTCTLDLKPGARAIGASFDRFGICTPWIDGNSVTAYFDDLQYTCSPMDTVPK
jgi:hypothetical protein